MKERIEKSIEIISSGDYDQEQEHCEYDAILEAFILEYDPELLPLMKKLIELEKDFWHA